MNIKVLPQETELGTIYHVYTSDLEKWHGDYISISDLIGKLTALNKQENKSEKTK